LPLGFGDLAAEGLEGDRLGLSYEVMQITADTDLRLAIFTAEPGSHSQEALDLLARWAATPDQLPGEHPAADDTRRP